MIALLHVHVGIELRSVIAEWKDSCYMYFHGRKILLIVHGYVQTSFLSSDYGSVFV